jgi:transcriptional regulator with XRE-family HTH domain
MDRIETARRQVTKYRGRYAEIAEAVGVSVKWVNKFAQGKLEEPGARKFEKLEDWLQQQ